jgi:photosystem II stability/assembly factor-like uncharacterized protein
VKPSSRSITARFGRIDGRDERPWNEFTRLARAHCRAHGIDVDRSRAAVWLSILTCLSCGGNNADRGMPDGGGGSTDAGSGNTAGPAAALRFVSVPTAVVAGEPFDVSIAVEDARGNPAAPPAAVTLSVLPHTSGVTLAASSTSAAPGIARFSATLDRDALSVFLVATAATLQAKSGAIDVRATHDQANWQLVGVEGAMLRDLVSSPAAPRALLAIDAFGGMFLTTDGAASWARPRAVGLPPAALSVAWCADGSLYVDAVESGSNARVYRSQDNGATFQPMGGTNGFLSCDADGTRPFLTETTATPALTRWDGSTFSPVPGGPVGAVSVAPDGRGAFATSSSGGVFRSNDGGVTWAKTALARNAVSVLAVSAETALAVDFEGGLQRTADGGATWAPVLRDVVAVTRAAKGMVTALDRDGGIRRSADGGASWTDPIGALPSRQSVSVVDSETGTWVATGRAVYVLDGGSFRLATTGMGGLAGAVFSDARTGFMYAAYDVGLYRFRAASPWELVLPGIVQRVRFHPSSTGTMFAGFADSVFVSTDSGASWSAMPGAPGVPFVAPDGQTWYADNAGLWRSDDAGASWSRLWQWTVGSPRVSAMAFEGGAIVFGSVADIGKVRNGVFRSDDGGATFTLTGISAPTGQLLRLGSSLLVPSEVSRSDDFGRTFKPLFPKHSSVSWVAIHPSDARTFLALEEQIPGPRPPAIYRSADGGSTWTRCLSGLDRFRVMQLELDPMDATTVYAATDHGIYRSTNVCSTR